MQVLGSHLYRMSQNDARAEALEKRVAETDASIAKLREQLPAYALALLLESLCASLDLDLAV